MNVPEEPSGCGCLSVLAGCLVASTISGLIGGFAYNSVWIGLAFAAGMVLFYALLLLWVLLSD